VQHRCLTARNWALFKQASYYSTFKYMIHWLYANNRTCFRAIFAWPWVFAVSSGEGRLKHVTACYIKTVFKPNITSQLTLRKQNPTLKSARAVQWLRRLVTGLSPRRLGFDPRSVHLGFVVDIGTGLFFHRVLRFSPVTFIPPVLHYTEKQKKVIFITVLHNKQ
jgi:hypothetical protein